MKVKTLTLSFSSISTWQRCRRQWANKYLHGFNPEDSSPALDFGSVLHEALAVLHSPDSFKRPPSTADAIEQELAFLSESDGVPDPQAKSAVMQALSVVAATGMGKLPKDRLFKPYDFERYSMDHAFRLVGEYAKHYMDEPIQGTGTEKTFDLRVTDRIFIRGAIDGLGIYFGKPTLIEHKTSGNLWKFKEQAHASMQSVGYIWAAKQLGLKCDQVLYNGLLTQWGKTNRKLRNKPEDCFLRTLVGVLPHRVEEFERMVVIVGNEIIRHIEGKEEFIKSAPEGCFKFGKDCPYLEACSCDQRTEEIVLNSLCEPKPWDGLEVVGE
jgi:hypothetical protein